jgi:hypothetical protein
MKRPWALILVGVCLAAAVALAFFYPSRMVSPGKLSPAHARLANDCFACHAPFRGADSSRCIACHALSDIGRRTTKGVAIAQRAGMTPFHQALAERDCLACHTEHQGSGFTQRSRKPFDHALLPSPARERCESCHAAPKDDVHRDLSAPCGQCHDSRRWKPATFDHNAFFALDRDHNTKCVTCHVQNNFKSYTCFGCHEHQPDSLRAKHLRDGVRDFENCVECHRGAHGEHGGRDDD